jgi:hypothetical protein
MEVMMLLAVGLILLFVLMFFGLRALKIALGVIFFGFVGLGIVLFVHSAAAGTKRDASFRHRREAARSGQTWSSGRRYATASHNHRVNTDQAISQIEQMCDPMIGRGQTRRIARIVTDDSRSADDRARDIVRGVPTGLDARTDRVVKDAAFKLHDILGKRR